MNILPLKWRRFFWLASLVAGGASASVQTFNITTPGGANGFFYNVTSGSTNFGTDPTIHLKIGVTYTLAINCDSAHLFFLSTNPAPANCNNNANYYFQHTNAFSSSALANPPSVATVDFTPPAPDTVYFYCRNHCFKGAFVIDPVLPDATSSLMVNPAILPTNGTATVTLTPKNSGSTITASATNFALNISGAAGSFSALTPASGTNFTATLTVGTNAGTFAVSNGIAGAATAPVLILNAIPLASHNISYISGAASAQLTAQGFSNLPLRVLVSENFLTWSNLGTATSTAAGLFQFSDTNAPSSQQRFYRLIYP